ncbi:hypothetical protein BDC45DRAFT_565811 [Circinella umbellata]|nr:hypothetical protein BDC45DRAFT_565811 [Circinella umbellata]
MCRALPLIKSITYIAFDKIGALKINVDVERLVFDRSTFVNQTNSEILRLDSQMPNDDGSNRDSNNYADDEEAAFNMELELAEKAGV